MPFTNRTRVIILAGLIVSFVGPRSGFAEDAVRLEERYANGDQYSVKTRSEVSGTLTAPVEKGKAAGPPLSIRGDSAIEYDERVLDLAPNGQVRKTIRICRRVDFQRTVDDRPDKSTLRPSVRRLVLLREGREHKAPFSPDGPLTWGEIDLIRTDIFVPVLVGLLPSGAMKPGDTWSAAEDAVLELTGLSSLDEGKLECRLETVALQGTHRQARVALAGKVRGMSEDGTSSQQVKGHFLFDLDAGRLTYVELRGVHSLLSAEGREVGRIEGRFVLSRQNDVRPTELSDASLRGLAQDPDADNTLLLYDNVDVGVRFLYPRRWRIAGASGNQVAVDAPDGSGFLLTLEAPTRTPSGAQLLTESRAFLERQKAHILRVDPPRMVQDSPPREHLVIEAEMNGQKFLMDYHVSRQSNGGAVLAGRLLPREQAALQREMEHIAGTVVVTKRIDERK